MTRYRLDSQFHCSYLESRGIPGGNRGKYRGETREIRLKNAGNYLPFISGFQFTTSGSGDVISGDVISGDATSGDVISGDDPPTRSPTNNEWMVPLSYLGLYELLSNPTT